MKKRQLKTGCFGREIQREISEPRDDIGGVFEET